MKTDVTAMRHRIDVDANPPMPPAAALIGGTAAKRDSNAPMAAELRHDVTRLFEATVKREWTMARAWRHADLRENTPRADRPHGC